MKTCDYSPIRKILLAWYMEGENFGDTLIYQTVSSRLEEKGFEVDSHEVGDDGRKIFEHANQCDFLLFAGGGIIERYVPPVIKYFKVNKPLLEVPYGIIGFGMGTFDYQQYEEAISCWVNSAEFFYVRDEATKFQLDEISQTNKVVYSADCVFGNKKIQQMCNKSENMYGVNIRNLPYKDLTGDWNWDRLNQVLQFVGCNFLISDSSNEAEFLKLKIENFDEIDKYRELKQEEKIELIINEIMQCKWIVAMRFHVVLVAAMLGIVTVPIKYCPKVKYLSEQLGLEELAVEVDEYEQISDKVKLLTENQQLYRIIVNENIDKMKKRADAMFEEVITFLEQKQI